MPAARGYSATPSTSPQGLHLQAAQTDIKSDTDVADATPSTGETPQSSPQTRSARRQARRRRQRQRKRERRLQGLQSESTNGQGPAEPELPASSQSHNIGSAATVAPYISSFSSTGVPLLAYGIANPAGMNPEVWNAFADGLKPGYPTRHGNEVFELMMTKGRVAPKLESE